MSPSRATGFTSGRFSFDTNILVYAIDRDAVARNAQAARLLDAAPEHDCVLSLQTLAEFFFVATRKGRATPHDAERVVASWRDAFDLFAPDAEVLGLAIALHRTARLAFWDAYLLATVDAAGCKLLFSEDMQDGGRIGGVTIINPFNPANAHWVAAAMSVGA